MGFNSGFKGFIALQALEYKSGGRYLITYGGEPAVILGK
jgi:hypothetical protein